MRGFRVIHKLSGIHRENNSHLYRIKRRTKKSVPRQFKIMPTGTKLVDRSICSAIPFPYSCTHVRDFYGDEVFKEKLATQGGYKYPRCKWILLKYGKRIELDLDALALSKAKDRLDEGKLNRLKAVISSYKDSEKTSEYAGDFKTPEEACQYLIEIGVLSAMPRVAVEKQENLANGTSAKPEKSEKTVTKLSHLTKLENAPEYMMVLRIQEMMEFFGSVEATKEAIDATIEHLGESEEKWNKYVQTVRTESEALGLNADEVEADLQKKKRQRIEKVSQSLKLNLPKEE